ncbi:MAG: recombination mediator RecR [Planctomycetota bacterium]
MKVYPEPMVALMEEFGRMPGIGRKTAERLAYYLLRLPEAEAMKLAHAIRDVKQKIRHCSRCFNISETDPCGVCSDPRRDQNTVCVVEEPKDVIAIEKMGRYNGIYHVLMGRIAPLEGVEPDDLTIRDLIERVRREAITEVILATNPNLEGDATALQVSKELEGMNVKITRIAKGIPSGSSIEYVNSAILADAMDGRREMR